MRIIGGTHKGRMIHAPQKLPVRPTTDFAKEALFNVLTNRIDFSQTSILDLFCGTGNISFEFASRGCIDITAVDTHFHCFSFVKKTAVELGFDSIRAVKANVFSFLKRCDQQFDLIFADPPYDMKEIATLPGIVFEKNMLKKDGLFILEHSAALDFTKTEHFLEHRSYSKVNFSIFQ